MNRTPADEMLGLLSGYWYSQSLYVMAQLGIADLLAKGPSSMIYPNEFGSIEVVLKRLQRSSPVKNQVGDNDVVPLILKSGGKRVYA